MTRKRFASGRCSLAAHRVVARMRRVSGFDPITRNRLRLWLRSERAFGLHSVRAVPEADVVAPAVAATRVVRMEAPMAKRGIAPFPMAAVELPLAAPPVASPFDAPALGRGQKVVQLKLMDDGEVSLCTRCRLHSTRTHTVFGEGNPEARIFFIGEGPGENEDLSGRPFVGRAGQLLDKMIGGMGLKRDDVYIANIVKCRPPNNRVPALDEVQTCTPYLVRQLEIIRPQVIVTLGRPSANYMLGTKLAMNRMRGVWHAWRGIKLMPTFHPSYVLRSYTEEVRAAVWSDLKKVLVELGIPVPGGRSS